MELIDKAEALAKIKERYEHYREKVFNSYNVQTEERMLECQHILIILNALEVKAEISVDEPVHYAVSETKDVDEAAMQYNKVALMTGNDSKMQAFKSGVHWNELRFLKILKELQDIANQEDGCLALENLQLRLSELTREDR